MKKKPKEYFVYVGNSMAVGLIESMHETLNAVYTPLVLAGISAGGVYLIIGLVHASHQMGIREIAIGCGILLCTVFIRPFITMLSRLYARAAKRRAQAFYDMTLRVPAGWYLEEEENENSRQRYEQQQQFDAQEAYRKYDAYVASAERKLNEQKIRLEREWARLHAERAQFDQQRAAQQRQAASRTYSTTDFFAGCMDEVSRKRRYRALLKIYHPDNMNGDKRIVEEINRQFERRR